MPSIKIFEEDLTLGGGNSTNRNVVYVPGFMSADGSAVANEPKLCETLSQFESYFGSKPVHLSDGGVDKSYIYAKELIASGLPVLYESMNNANDTNLSKDLMYYSLETAYEKLWDRGEYQFKYLTSGGYANFGVSYTYNSTSLSTVLDTITEHSLGEVTLLNEYKVDQNITLKYAGLNDRGSHKWEYDNGVTTTTFTESVSGDTFTLYTNEKDNKGKITITPVMSFTLPVKTSEKEYVRQADTKFTTTILLTVEDEVVHCAWKGVNNTTLTNIEKTVENSSLIATKMAKLTVSDSKEGESRSRGDCIALIDHLDNPDLVISGETSFYGTVREFASSLDGAENSAMFTPWVNMNFTTYNDVQSMPGSFAYLMALAKSIRTNPSWLAIAGATRGQIPNLYSEKPLNLNKVFTNAIAEGLQNRNGVSINAITNIKPFGYRIWGNRTLKDNSVEGNLTATSFLNTKTMICDVKKVVWDACRKFMFEQNNDVLWLNFKSYIEPTLDQMKTGAGLSGYKIIRGTTSEKAKLVATVKLYPLYAVEDFEVTVQMLDDEIAVS